MQKEKVEIIAHRGYWIDKQEKNSLVAIERAFKRGFGIETDFRDYCGELVISHNIPEGNEPKAEDVFSLYKKYNMDSILAINIKADGLYEKLKILLEKYEISNYFVFDMSIPDTIGYLRSHLNIASRLSEYEVDLPFYADSEVIWLDCFNSDWATSDFIETHLKRGKKVCLVSPELHDREYLSMWKLYAGISRYNRIVCTDYPDEADMFFNSSMI